MALPFTVRNTMFDILILFAIYPGTISDLFRAVYKYSVPILLCSSRTKLLSYIFFYTPLNCITMIHTFTSIYIELRGEESKKSKT